jgi:hypothetical protein
MNNTPPFRWSIRRAGIEFVRGHHLIMQSLRATGARPDKQGTFTTKQIVAAIFGRGAPLAGRAKEARLKQQILGMETARFKHDQLERRLINVSEIRCMWEDGLAKIAAIVRDSRLSPVEKKRLLQDLAQMKIEQGKYD